MVAVRGLAERLERLVRAYFDGCNEADVEKMAACFIPDAVHYFPPGMYGGPLRGARVIAETWARFVRERGSAWTVDRLLVDAASYQAVMEWTHWKTAERQYLRGDEWYVFDPETELISEIRAYYAAPVDRSIDGLELAGFDYAGRGYPLTCPIPRPLPDQSAQAAPGADVEGQR